MPCDPADNPFNTARVERLRYAFDPAQRHRLLRRCAVLGYGALVGPHGSGKTTLLEDLAGDLVSAGRVVVLQRLEADARIPALPDLPVGGWWLFDGAGLVGRWRLARFRWWARRRGIVLLITSHRAGGWPVLHRHRVDPALVDALLPRLLPEDWQTYQATAQQAFARHAGNLREVWRACYDQAAGRPAAMR